ncbi:psychosine receptor-like [Scleropages formosus]|uniref:Psychosine receptor-like n=1 Tax=Scleropages formosus TaxID=113540 RepID=A0A0P7UKW2_SCLFO|nr:ovarian cancer G-protein coupled receptor 1-like [Scleropages formosus]KPP69047.1 psychosine receptor-like [Scleropages formosus]
MESFNFTNLNNSSNSSYTSTLDRVTDVVGWVTLGIGVPLNCLAIYVLSHSVKDDRTGPVYIINLLVTNAFNFFGRPKTGMQHGGTSATPAPDSASLVFYYGVITNISFMVCVAMESHVRSAHPRWYSRYSTVRRSTLVSLIAWVTPLALLALAIKGYLLVFSISLLFPLPCLIFLFLDSCRVLCCSTSQLPSTERKRIVGTLALLLGDYTLLFLPFVLKTLLTSLSMKGGQYEVEAITNILLDFSPLVDPLLFLFVKNDPRDIAKAFPCCSRFCVRPPDAGTVTTATIPTVSGRVTGV